MAYRNNINKSYKVAEHIFRLSYQSWHLSDIDMNNLRPFEINCNYSDSHIFDMQIVEMLDNNNYESIGDFEDDIASIKIFKSAQRNWRFQIAPPKSPFYCIMETDPKFKNSKILLPDDIIAKHFCLNNCLMLLYAFATAKLNTLMIHASAIKIENEGFIFLGKSGTGKSTHSRLWLQHIANSQLLNDDNPILRIINNKPLVFGSPWSGKTPCYKNDYALLKGIVKLEQAPYNKIIKLKSIQSYAVLLSSSSKMSWEDDLMSGIHNTLENIIFLVRFYKLECLPNEEAARLCMKTIKNDIE